MLSSVVSLKQILFPSCMYVSPLAPLLCFYYTSTEKIQLTLRFALFTFNHFHTKYVITGLPKAPQRHNSKNIRQYSKPASQQQIDYTSFATRKKIESPLGKKRRGQRCCDWLCLCAHSHDPRYSLIWGCRC